MNQLITWILTIFLSMAIAGQGRATEPLPPDERPSLVIDFIGLNDESPEKHARGFADTVMPGAKVYAFGFHGVAQADDQRMGKGYQRILRSGTAADRNAAASAVLDYTKSRQTVLAFDFNESMVPQQLRSNQTRWLPVKYPW